MNHDHNRGLLSRLLRNLIVFTGQVRVRVRILSGAYFFVFFLLGTDPANSKGSTEISHSALRTVCGPPPKDESFGRVLCACAARCATRLIIKWFKQPLRWRLRAMGQPPTLVKIARLMKNGGCGHCSAIGLHGLQTSLGLLCTWWWWWWYSFTLGTLGQHTHWQVCTSLLGLLLQTYFLSRKVCRHRSQTLLNLLIVV